MRRTYRAGRIAEELCANLACTSFGEIRDAGTAPESVMLAENLPCRLKAFRVLGVGWVCAEGAPAPIPVIRVAKLLFDSLKHARHGYVVIYYRNLRVLGEKDYYRALAMIKWLARTCKCEIRANSYKCSEECVAGIADGLALKLKELFGVQI